MNTYRSGSTVTEEIQLVDDTGIPLIPISVTYRILNESGIELVAQTATSFAVNDSSVTVVTSTIINALTAGSLKGFRVIELKLTFDTGNVTYLNNSYLLEVENSLVQMTNSYQTLNEAKLLLLDMPDMPAWEVATDRKRMAAMTEAFLRIGKLNYNIYGLLIPSRENTVVSNRINIDFGGTESVSYFRTRPTLNALTQIEFAALPSLFSIAVKKAQLSEADIILGGDPISKKREEGLMSDSVGESSVMFRQGKPLLLAVGRRTLDYLSGWVYFSPRLGRG